MHRLAILVLGAVFALTPFTAPSANVLVQRQLEKVRVAANEWVLFWLRLVFRVCLA
jgi:hypothetical protein